jgi:hypothetical protein
MQKIFEENTQNTKTNKSEDKPECKNNLEIKITNIPSVNRYIYCEGKNIVKRGKRKKKLEQVQLYYCNDGQKTFTGQKLKGKTYPVRLILDGV